MKKGRQQGMQQGLFLSAKTMLLDNLDAPTVSRYTTLPLEEVAKLQSSICAGK